MTSEAFSSSNCMRFCVRFTSSTCSSSRRFERLSSSCVACISSAFWRSTSVFSFNSVLNSCDSVSSLRVRSLTLILKMVRARIKLNSWTNFTCEGSNVLKPANSNTPYTSSLVINGAIRRHVGFWSPKIPEVMLM